MMFSIMMSTNPDVLRMCSGGAAAPPPPPPPAPEPAAPVMVGAKDSEILTNKSYQKMGKRKLQIPLTPVGGSTGLGIPTGS